LEDDTCICRISGQYSIDGKTTYSNSALVSFDIFAA
jgi:hypothetical protein